MEQGIVSKEELQNLLSLGVTKSQAASRLGISRTTLYNLMSKYRLQLSKYSSVTDEHLNAEILHIKAAHPNAGEVMVNGHLRSRCIIVQRHRLRQALLRVDSEGINQRRLTTIHRRLYSVPCPNFIWHLDGNHKLIRWKLVVHGAMDGYSRMVLFLKCSNNNRANTVTTEYLHAVEEFSRPLHVRTDLGGENVGVWEDMRSVRGESSVVTGSSVHNQRIERFNRDLNRNCSHVYAPVFYDLESKGILDPNNKTDIFCLHYIYLPRVNRTINEFRAAHNHHSISTERHATPIQLYMADRHLLHIHSPHTASEDTILPEQQPATNDTFSPLNEHEMLELSQHIDPFHDDQDHGKTNFQGVQMFVLNKLTAVHQHAV